MTCAQVEPDLVAYHFAELDEPARSNVESHLVGCPACCGAFVALKRAIETGVGGAPSATSRERLRRAVAAELGVASPKRRRWERPLAFAIAACAVLTLGAATKALTAGPGVAPYAVSHAEPDSAPHSTGGRMSPR